MKKSFAAGAALFIALSFLAAGRAGAWLVDTKAEVNTNSHNDSSLDVSDHSTYMRNTYNQRYDNRQDRSEHLTNSFNTDDHSFTDNRQDRSAKDSYNDYADKSNRSTNGSYNKALSTGGDVRNSVLGDFNQLYNGTDFRSGVTGSNNTIDTSSVNITTLGDTLK